MTCIFSLIGSGGKKNTAADGHSYHAYTSMIAFTCFLIVTLLSCMNCCTFNKVPRSIVDDMYLVNVIKLMLFLHIILYINQI